jgi:hypothetical protein
MDFTDIAGRYLQARMDQATRPFTDPEGYMNDRMRQQFGTDMSGNAKPVTQTITTDPATGEQMMTVKGRPQDLSASNPNTPTVTPPQPRFNMPNQYMNMADTASTQPVSYQPPAAAVAPAPAPAPAPTTPVQPDQTFQRMLQAESNNQQFTPQGQVVTSPKGAMGAAQVMPSTAMQPGYGVTNIFDLAQQRGVPVPSRDQAGAQQLLGNEQLNREFGQNYFNAMQQRFPNQPEASVAAYNAGPGRVAQNMQANAGQLNRGQLPAETQAYLQKTGATSEPNATIPPANPADAVATTQYQTATGNVATQGDYNLFYGRQVIDNLNDPVKLSEVIDNPNAPDFAKVAANRQMLQMLTMRKEQMNAQKTVDQGDTNAIANALKSRSDEGSYIKAYLFSRLGLNDLAQSEQAKLGAGRVWEQNTLDTGEQALIQRSSNGLPIFGISQTGKELTPQELIKFGGAAIKGTEQGATVYKDPFYRAEVRDAQGNVVQPAQGVAGNWILERRPGRQPIFREAGTNRMASPEEARRLNPTGVSGPIEQQAASAYATRGAGQQGAQAAEGYANAPLPPAPGMAAPGQAATGSVTGTAAMPTTPVSTAGGQPTVTTAIPNALTTPVYEQKRASAIAEKRTETFNKIIDTEYRENGARGEIVSTNRKLQFDILNRDDPATGKKVAELISGLQTAANEDPKNQKWSIVRDIFAGKVATNPDGTPMNGQQLSDRVTQLNISSQAKSALQEFNALNAQIAGQTLRETAGPGSVSDAEQQANRARNVEITKTPMLGVYNMMSQSQFNADLQRYKSDLAGGPSNTATNATAFDSQFRRYQSELIKSYREVTEARLKYIQENGAGPGAIREGYKRYPVPEYDPNSGGWRYLKPIDKIIKKKEEPV